MSYDVFWKSARNGARSRGVRYVEKPPLLSIFVVTWRGNCGIPERAEFTMESLSVRELRQRCEQAGVNVLGMTEKSEMIEALLAAEAASKPTVKEVEEEEDDEALLAQALLMSQESEASLSNLSIRELRERCAARDISTRGMTTKAEMVAALFGGAPSEETPPTEAAASSISAGERLATQPPSEVLATFGVRFACFAAADVPGLPGAAAIEQTGKVLLPRSCLAGLAFLSSLPTTMLLRLSLQERTVYVGVADFIDDHLAFDKASAAGYLMPRWGPGAAGVAAAASDRPKTHTHLTKPAPKKKPTTSRSTTNRPT